MPYANPEDRRTFDRERARKRRAAGLCINCSEVATSSARCPRHLQERKARRSAARAHDGHTEGGTE